MQTECSKLSEDLFTARLTAARLEEQAAAFLSLRDRLGSLEEERKESSAWLHDAAAELAVKSDESATLRAKLAATEARLEAESKRAEHALTQLSSTEAAASEARQTASEWERALAAARTELAVLRIDLGAAKEKLAVATEKGMEALGLKEQNDEVLIELASVHHELEKSQAHAAQLQVC